MSKLKRSTKVHIKAFDAIIINECTSGYRVSVAGRKKGNKVWAALPTDMIEVIENE